MKIAIMSDSHDNIWNIQKALNLVKAEGAEMIIHCGDFVAPFSLEALNAAGIPMHGVFGNNDGDRYLLTTKALTQWDNIHLHGMVGSIEADGLTIGIAHEYVKARGLAADGNFRIVCYGHSHEYHQEEFNGTLLLNPGEIMGKDGHPGFCLFETRTFEIKRTEIV